MQHLSRNKRPFIGHLHRPSFRVSGPKQVQLAHTGQELTPRSCKVTVAVTLGTHVIKERKEGRVEGRKREQEREEGKEGRKRRRTEKKKLKQTESMKADYNEGKVF